MVGRLVGALVLLACLTACGGSDEPDTLTGPNGDIECFSTPGEAPTPIRQRSPRGEDPQDR